MTELTLHPADAAAASATCSLWSKTMPASTGSSHARPNSAPAHSWHHRDPPSPAFALSGAGPAVAIGTYVKLAKARGWACETGVPRLIQPA